MHFTKTFLSFFAVGSAIAFPGERQFSKRDLQTIQGEIEKVSTSLGDLSTAIQGLSTDPNSAAPLLTASENSNKVIGDATTAIQATDELSLTDALSLQGTATQLGDSVTGTINALVEKKPILDQLGVTSIAVQTLQSQKTSSDALGQAIVSKVPAIGQNIAQQSIQAITQAIDDGITKLQAPAAGAGGAETPTGEAATPVETPAAGAEVPATGAGTPAEGSVTTTVELNSPTMTIIPVEAANGTCMCSIMQ